jgi:hypothetical protein
MIDTSSLDSIIQSRPKLSRPLEGLLAMKLRQEDAIAPATASLAQRGFIGCFPFAHHKADELVLHLRPGQPLAKTRVGVAFWSFTEGLTIAPDLARFVAGRLAHLDITQVPKVDDEKLRAELLRFSGEWGGPEGTESTERVLAAVPGARERTEAYERMAALWEAADPREPYFQVLGKAWSLAGDELGAWVDTALQRFPEEELLSKLYVSHHVLRKTGVDVTDAAWKVVLSDALFDATYTGANQGAAFKVWKYAPLAQAVKWLDTQNPQGLDKPRALSLEAARAFAREPKTYSGVDHLEAARELKTDAPELAYTHAVTAAAFYVRATDKTPAASIALCHELARDQKWPELSQVLGWTMEELGA